MDRRAGTLHIGVRLDGAGGHPAAWREHDADAAHVFDAGRLVALARLAERGMLDFVTLGDGFGAGSTDAGRVRGRLDALLAMARVAPATSAIGLVPTVTTTHTEPFHVSKNVATLDLVSAGRGGWNVEVSTTDEAARLFGRKEPAPLDDLWAEAGEAIDVVGRLWDSWEDDAVIRDVATGRYLDRSKVHHVDFEGRFFGVRGPSITPRPPQGQPVVVVEATSPEALTVAVEWADVVILHVATADEAAARRTEVRAAAEAIGRHPDDVLVLAALDVLLDDDDAQAVRARLDALVPARPAVLDLVGAPADLVALVATWAGAVDGFLIRPARLPQDLGRLVDAVVPELQARGLVRSGYMGCTLRDHLGLARPANRYATVAPDATGTSP